MRQRRSILSLKIAARMSLVGMLGLVACRSQNQRGRIESYRALAVQELTQIKNAQPVQNKDSDPIFAHAQLSAASILLAREDLLPCESLPPRKLTKNDGHISWLDGSWSNFARAFIVKGSAQSGQCKLEIRPFGQITLNPGGRDPFIRGSQIRILITAASGDTLIPPANEGVVNCKESDGAFTVSFDGYLIGKSSISYVMNEAVPLELSAKVCLARVLDVDRKITNDWVFVIPERNVAAQDSAPQRTGR